MHAGTVESVDGETGLSKLSRDERGGSNVTLLRRGKGEWGSGEEARGVEIVGDAMEEEALDRVADSSASSPAASVELRSGNGNLTAVEILSVGMRREGIGVSDVADCIMVIGSAC